MADRDPNPSPPVPTLMLLGYLSTLLTWELQIAVVLIDWFAGKQVNPTGYRVLLGLTSVMTVYFFVRAKNDFGNLAWTRGRIPLTRAQIMIITVTIIAFGCVGAWTVDWLVAPH